MLIPCHRGAAGKDFVTSIVKEIGNCIVNNVVLGAPPLELGQLPSLHPLFIEEPVKDAATRDAGTMRTGIGRHTTIFIISLTTAIIKNIEPAAAAKAKEADPASESDRNAAELARLGAVVGRRGQLAVVRGGPPIPLPHPIPPHINHTVPLMSILVEELRGRGGEVKVGGGGGAKRMGDDGDGVGGGMAIARNRNHVDNGDVVAAAAWRPPGLERLPPPRRLGAMSHRIINARPLVPGAPGATLANLRPHTVTFN